MELLAERLRASGRSAADTEDVEKVRQLCVFTTHPPVPAAHDQLPMDLAARVLGSGPMDALTHLCCYSGALNLTYLALNFSHDVLVRTSGTLTLPPSCVCSSTSTGHCRRRSIPVC
jgi:starch phosphorylase